MPVPTPASSLLLRRVSLHGYDRAVDVRLSGEIITQVGPGLDRPAGEEPLDGGGGQLVPGLHDHHVHLRASAAALDSIDVGPGPVTGSAEFAATLRMEDRRRPAGQWIRAVGYHESIAGDIGRRDIDALVAARPVRIQHRSGILWVLNSAGLDAIGADRDPPPRAGADRGPADRPDMARGRMAPLATAITSVGPGLDQFLRRRGRGDRIHRRHPASIEGGPDPPGPGPGWWVDCPTPAPHVGP